MGKRLVGDFILIVSLLVFSWWLMGKSFGYDTKASQFRVARHEVGDFGLHLSLIRSFAWGNNRPPQSPFFAGPPLVYHYGVDWVVGQLVRWGIRIDYALNGFSAVALTMLLYGLYRLTLFVSRSRAAGIVAILLFVLPSNVSWLEMLKRAPFDASFFAYVWQFPDYIHKGPFDGSIVTIYTTLSPYLNQRHLIAGSAIGVVMMYAVSRFSDRLLPVFLGVLLGLLTRVHVLIAAATALVLYVLLVGKRTKALLLVLGIALLISLPYVAAILLTKSASSLSWRPGYLMPQPPSLGSWLSFWAYNLGVLIVLIPFAYRGANALGRRIMIGAGMLFLIANLVQVSYRIEHNHSLINYATVLVFPAVATVLIRWFRRGGILSALAVAAFLMATASGVFNIMVVKNDYQTMIDDAPRNQFIQWVRTQTPPESVFISTHALYDPVTLAGRKNYLGQEYYVTVMGYDYWGRRKQVDTWLGNMSRGTLTEMKAQNIDYLVIPEEKKEFPFDVDEETVKALLPVVYWDESVHVYAL